MQTQLIDTPEKRLDCPCLRYFCGNTDEQALIGPDDPSSFVVLFNSTVHGVVVHVNDQTKCLWHVGHSSNSWTPKCFKPFDGIVQLRNDK